MLNDEDYITPDELQEWFVKNPNEPYRKKTTLEYYYAKGWLKKGRVSPEDRLRAGKILQTDYYISGLLQQRAIDYEKPRVDGDSSGIMTETQLFHLNRFNKAIACIKNSLAHDVVDLIVVLDKDIRKPNKGNDWVARKSNIAIRNFLIMGLDDLVAFYTPKQKKIEINGYSVKGVWE
jgi:hypothetical protein